MEWLNRYKCHIGLHVSCSHGNRILKLQCKKQITIFLMIATTNMAINFFFTLDLHDPHCWFFFFVLMIFKFEVWVKALWRVMSTTCPQIGTFNDIFKQKMTNNNPSYLSLWKTILPTIYFCWVCVCWKIHSSPDI